VLARERGISSKAVAKDAIEEGAVSRRELEGLRVEVDDTTDRASASRSRFERVESLVRRRRPSSSLLLLEALELPVNRLHMMLERSQGARCVVIRVHCWQWGGRK
jgi:hypothetical protein